MPKLIELPLTSIEVGTDRARDFDPAWAAGLAGIIAAQGLKHPITVRVVDGINRLVAGRYRLEAARILGWEAIPCILSEAGSDDAARLEEVMENLGRAELIALDRCHHLYELKVVWERIYPQTAHGKASPKSQTLALSSEAPEVFGFAKANAERIGLGVSAIKMAVKIWKGLSPASRAALVGTDIATKQTELKALSEEKPAVQAKILDLIFGDVHPVHNVAQALSYLANGVSPDARERFFTKISATLAALDDTVFEDVIIANEDRVVAALKRRGRL
jgi:ParB family chromosome partitioning protein